MFRSITPRQIHGNVFELISKRRFLLTANNGTSFNTMTASWGAFVRMWNEDCVSVAVRPQRRTFSFMEASEAFTLSFFDNLYAPALDFCGTHSGRDCDKAAETGLIPVNEGNITYFAQADIVIICKKIYVADISPKSFTDGAIAEKFYSDGDFHRVYTGKIENVLYKK